MTTISSDPVHRFASDTNKERQLVKVIRVPVSDANSDVAINTWIFKQKLSTPLGIEVDSATYLMLKYDWLRSDVWNYRELSRFKRTPGMSIPFYFYVKTIGLGPISDSLVIYIDKEKKYYSTSFESIQKFFDAYGIVYFDDVPSFEVMAKNVGLSKDIFKELIISA